MWLGVDLRMNTKKTCVNVIALMLNRSSLNGQHDWGDLYGHDLRFDNG